jgi:hypothetical protein
MIGWKRWAALSMVVFSATVSFGSKCDINIDADDDGIFIDVDDDDDDFDWSDLFD